MIGVDRVSNEVEHKIKKMGFAAQCMPSGAQEPKKKKKPVARLVLDKE